MRISIGHEFQPDQVVIALISTPPYLKQFGGRPKLLLNSEGARFNSADLVNIFAAGEYEDAIERNSTWATGDWSGNGEFDSADLVLAFQDGGYELGPREAVRSVPEPNKSVAAVSFAVLIGWLVRRRRFVE